MKTTFTMQLWIAFKIWFFSVVANTLLGAIYMSFFMGEPGSFGFFLMVGAGYGAVFSFPVFLVLLLIINICINWSAKSHSIFRIVFISAILLTLCVFAVFLVFMGGLGHMIYALAAIAILSAIIGVASQSQSLFTLGSDFNKLNNLEL